MKAYNLSYDLDKRRKKKNGKFPLRLKVYCSKTQKRKYFKTEFEFTISEYQSIFKTIKPKNEAKKQRLFFDTLIDEYESIAEKISPFSIIEFEKKAFYKDLETTNNVKEYYLKAIKDYKKIGRQSTALNYEASLKSIEKFEQKNIGFDAITKEWLEAYEYYHLQNGLSKTSIGFYLRPLRAIYNTAIDNKVVSKDLYPFGKKKYSIPNPKGVKKALTETQLKTLFEAEPLTPEQERAKDFWFFSYVCNGMNFKDILNLKYKDIKSDTIIFYREKTKNTNKNQAPIIIYLNDFSKSIIEKYGTNKEFIFPYIDKTADAEKQLSQLKNFIRSINQNIKKLALSVGINEPISTYWARHTFATTSIQKGASIEFVGEALGHTDIKTTKGYFAGFEDKTKRDIANKLLDFET